tara:strand:+ start:4789 stop:5229 length:441 start_codon:yes stop_codon:yes gene_type:complete
MAKSINVAIEINAPIHEVWDEISNISNHPNWMSDAESIKFLGQQKEGVGTKILVLTKIGPIKLNDLMTFTKWEQNAEIEVEHEGIVTGKGSFLLEALENKTTKFSWRETLKFPIILGGVIGEIVGSYILERIWKKNITNLKKIIEQ